MGFCLNLPGAFLTLSVFRLSVHMSTLYSVFRSLQRWLHLIRLSCLLVPSRDHSVQKVSNTYLLNE